VSGSDYISDSADKLGIRRVSITGMFTVVMQYGTTSSKKQFAWCVRRTCLCTL